jgi:hypothetical protein
MRFPQIFFGEYRKNHIQNCKVNIDPERAASLSGQPPQDGVTPGAGKKA